MFRVKTLNKISPLGLSVLDRSRFMVSSEAEDPDAVLVRSANMHDYEFNDALRCIARAGAGTNNIPIERASENGVVVFNTPGANAEAVKELVLCALFLSSRDLIGGTEWVRSLADKGDEVAALVEKGKSNFAGPEIFGKTLGVVGLGAIGAKVANAAEKLGMTVYGYDPYLSVDAAWNLSRNIHHALDLETIYKNCDYITLHVPATADTEGMINSDAISLMKGQTRIINLARGELVNDGDMIAALEQGKIARYVTDFPNGSLVGRKNVIALPHLGASTPESEDKCAVMAAQQLADYLQNGNITNSVNLPTVVMDRNGIMRICVIHRNLPKTINSFLEKIGRENINVENMINKSKGDYAYTVIDASARVHESLADEIRELDGVLRVRLIAH